jgi:hypothetical protein
LRPLGDGSTNAGNVFSNLATSWSFRCTTSSVRFGSQLGNIRLNQWHKVDQSRSMCFFLFLWCVAQWKLNEIMRSPSDIRSTENQSERHAQGSVTSTVLRTWKTAPKTKIAAAVYPLVN